MEQESVEILEVKNIISEIGNSIDGLNSILDTAEERISKLEERSVENKYIESQAEKKGWKMQESKRCMGHNERCKIYEFDVPEREEKEGRTEAISEEKEIFF